MTEDEAERIRTESDFYWKEFLQTRSFRDKIVYYYLPDFLLVLILPLTLTILFWNSFNPNQVHFSNDGPLGIMVNPSLCVPYTQGPGAPIWSDNYWLGSDWGNVPFSFSGLILWFFHSPIRAISFLVVPGLIGICLAELYHQYLVMKGKRK